VAGGVRHSAVEAVLIVLVGDNDAGAFGTYTQAGD
jgi:Mn2+/Fe2+ NRAMP family transporter